jgi:hypothetical protein
VCVCVCVCVFLEKREEHDIIRKALKVNVTCIFLFSNFENCILLLIPPESFPVEVILIVLDNSRKRDC